MPANFHSAVSRVSDALRFFVKQMTFRFLGIIGNVFKDKSAAVTVDDALEVHEAVEAGQMPNHPVPHEITPLLRIPHFKLLRRLRKSAVVAVA